MGQDDIPNTHGRITRHLTDLLPSSILDLHSSYRGPGVCDRPPRRSNAIDYSLTHRRTERNGRASEADRQDLLVRVRQCREGFLLTMDGCER